MAVLGQGRRAQTPSFAPAPQFRNHPRFLAKITQNLNFLRFQILEKWANLRLPLNVQKLKVLRFRGLRPLTLWSGALPPDPRYRLVLPRSSWHGAVPTPPTDIAGWNCHCLEVFMLKKVFARRPSSSSISFPFFSPFSFFSFFPFLLLYSFLHSLFSFRSRTPKF